MSCCHTSFDESKELGLPADEVSACLASTLPTPDSELVSPVGNAIATGILPRPRHARFLLHSSITISLSHDPLFPKVSRSCEHQKGFAQQPTGFFAKIMGTYHIESFGLWLYALLVKHQNYPALGRCFRGHRTLRDITQSQLKNASSDVDVGASAGTPPLFA